MTKYTLILIIIGGIHTWVYVVPLSAAEICRFDRFKMQRQEFISQTFKGLNLTPEQKKQIEGLRVSLDKKQKDTGKKIKEKREALRKELEKEKSDEGAIDVMIGDLVGLIKRRIKTRVKCIMEVKDVLTSEQFELFQKKVKELKSQGGENKRFYLKD